MRLTLCALATAVLSCAPAATDPKPVDPAPPPPSSAADAAPVVAKPRLPPGVLARVQGKQGVIEVIERDGRRLLTIGGVVQGAKPLSGPLGASDPMVALLKAARPNAKRALVIGLGTGASAMALSRAGLRVDAVELEPHVIALARKYFGYTGRAIAADGATYLATTKTRYDVVLIDAFTANRVPRTLVSHGAIRTLVSNNAPDVVVAVRAVAAPRDPWVLQMWANMLRGNRRLLHRLMFGSGLANERQNLYALTSPRPINLVKVNNLPVWPIHMARERITDPRLAPGAKPGTATRTIDVVGYIIRMADSSLALDLPHWEMGAVRYVLAGKPVAELAAKLPAKTTFPTAGDIRSDGNRRHTLQHVFGGGGAKRSEVRFSPLVAAVRGRARLVSVIGVNAALGVPRRMRKGAPQDPRLPYGGALYRLQLDRVHWSFTTAQSRQLERTARPHLRRAIRAIARGKLRKAVKHTKGYLYAYERRFKADVKHIVAYRELAALFDRLKTEAFAAGPSARPYARGVVCDRALADNYPIGRAPATAASRLGGALRSCAVRGYEQTLRRDKRHRTGAARRLLSLYDSLQLGGDKSRARAYRRKLLRLRKRFPKLRPRNAPPQRP